jgi:predicted nuclease of predicted toxin-antitoxin system
MRFLIDAHLPRRIARRLVEAGHDATHTLDLPNGNRTPDSEILSVAAREQRVVVTKDADFVNSHLLRRQPQQLLLISTGNISNTDLETLLLPNLPAIVAALADNNLVELTRMALIVHS